MVVGLICSVYNRTHIHTLPQKLTDIKGLSEAKIDKMLEAAKKMVTSYGWKSAAEEERQVCVVVFCGDTRHADHHQFAYTHHTATKGYCAHHHWLSSRQ